MSAASHRRRDAVRAKAVNATAVRARREGRLAVAAVAAAAAGAVVLLVPGGELWALKAAGAFNGHAIAGVEHFVNALKGNLVWLGGTAMALVIAVVGILFLAGHSRAHDIALKTAIGLAILASIGGIVA